MITNRDGAGDDAVPVEKVVFQSDFPAGQADVVVRYRDIVGKVQTAPTTDSFCIIDFRTGQTRTFRTDLVRKQCQS